MVSKKRARSQDDKLARRSQLLNAAKALHSERGLRWTMTEVARHSGLAKGTTYLYFATKEELLLALLTAELGDWFAGLEGQLNAADPAASIAADLAARPTLVALLAVQASILEQNLSLDAALAFKRFLLEHASGIAPRLEQLLPGANGVEVLQWLNALVVGLAQLSQPAPHVQAVLEHPELHVLSVDFQPALERSLRALFLGITVAGIQEVDP
jgi:AcrR family transcriptional regulator